MCDFDDLTDCEQQQAYDQFAEWLADNPDTVVEHLDGDDHHALRNKWDSIKESTVRDYAVNHQPSCDEVMADMDDDR